MIKVIEKEKQVTKCQSAFVKQLKSVCKQKIVCNVGYQGYSETVTAYYSAKYNFWFTYQRNRNRYWNAFGTGEPLAGKSNSITVEINFPYSGINRSVGGALAENDFGEMLILHRGKIGGGRRGIGKSLFLDQLRGYEFVKVDDGGNESEVCVIGKISSRFLPKQLSDFIANIDRIKNFDLESGRKFSALNHFKFSKEHYGKGKTKRSRDTVVNRVHGIVVNSLARSVEARGLSVGNDRNRDLFAHKRNRITTLFEIKVDSSTQSLYTAVGQLLVYSIPIKSPVRLVLVVPNELTKPVTERLYGLGIQILYYRWEEDEPVFDKIDMLLSSEHKKVNR
jgi:hypothetical protein